MEGLMMNRQLIIPLILDRAERLFGHKEITSCLPGRSIHNYNYRSLAGRVKKLSRVLKYLGVKEGDRVATFCWNHYQHLEAYFAVTCMGAVLHTLNIRLGAEDLEYIVNHAADKIIIVDQELLPLFEKFSPCIKPEKVIVIRQSEKPVPAGYLVYEEALDLGADEGFNQFNGNENTAALLCYTSGTTGKPKGVLYSHRSVVLNAMSFLFSCTGIGIEESDVVLPVVPMFHAAAWGFPFCAAFSGAAQVLPGPYLDAPSLLTLMADHQVTITGGVPTVFVNILNYLADHPQQYQLRLEKIILGGSAVPQNLIRDYKEKHGITVLNTWGMTELSPLGSSAIITSELKAKSEDDQFDFAKKQGHPIPLLEIRGRGENGLVPWDGKSLCELEVRGPCVASGYYMSEEPACNFTDDGWLKTGDIVVIHPNGYIDLKDRNKDIIKSGGEWISSILLESLLMSHHSVEDAAVIAVPDDKWMERPHAFIVLKKGRSATAAELKEFLKDKVAKFSIPDRFTFIDSIPKTAVGKTRKYVLRQRNFEENSDNK
ncbi:MAG TPA: long-chain fatty acid--CoA ligase [Bacteroidales bacterium]|nr:long-chain fatty acid--CoA ligase [Bacteroidales bacterium]